MQNAVKKILSNNPDYIVKEIVRKLVPEFRPTAIFLFGSRATGTAGPDSDYDLLIVVPKLSNSSRELSVRAREVLSKLDASFDIFFISKEKFDRQKNIVNTLADAAQFEGKELYAA